MAFQGPALVIANRVQREHPDVTVTNFIELLESKLFNNTQKKSRNSSFLSSQWDERTESIQQFGERVEAMGMSLDMSCLLYTSDAADD